MLKIVIVSLMLSLGSAVAQPLTLPPLPEPYKPVPNAEDITPEMLQQGVQTLRWCNNAPVFGEYYEQFATQDGTQDEVCAMQIWSSMQSKGTLPK